MISYSRYLLAVELVLNLVDNAIGCELIVTDWHYDRVAWYDQEFQVSNLLLLPPHR